MTRCCLDTRFHFEVARASTLNSIFFISPIFVRFNIPSLSFGKGAKRNQDLIKRGLQKYKIKCKKHFIFTQAQIVQRLDDAHPRSQGLPSSLLFEREVKYLSPLRQNKISKEWILCFWLPLSGLKTKNALF